MRFVPKKSPIMLRTMKGSLSGADLRRHSFFSKISLQSGQISQRRPQCREHVAHLHAITRWKESGCDLANVCGLSQYGYGRTIEDMGMMNVVVSIMMMRFLS